MPITRSWKTGKEAVNAFERYCLEQGWVFAEISGTDDFGKDGYVDLADADSLSGACVAVQIKGGRSMRTPHGYEIRATEANRRLWRDSTIPVIGIAWDPESSELYWMDLTATLERQGLEAPLIASTDSCIGTAEGSDQFRAYLERRAFPTRGLLELGSDDDDHQAAGVLAAFRMGLSDPRSLVLLRRVMFSLLPGSLAYAVMAISHALSHPDILRHDNNTPSPESRKAVRAEMRWTTTEVERMLRVLDDRWFERGSVGQCVELLLREDPRHEAIVEEVVATTDDETVGKFALLLAVYWADEDGQRRFDELLKKAPHWGKLPEVAMMRESLNDFGYIDIQ